MKFKNMLIAGLVVILIGAFVYWNSFNAETTQTLSISVGEWVGGGFGGETATPPNHEIKS